MTVFLHRPLGRRTVLLGAAALAAVPMLATRPTSVRAAGEFRIGYQKGSAVLITLKAEGTLEALLEPLGVTVSWFEFPAGAPLLEAMNAGSLDLGSAGAAPPVVGQAAGADLIYILANPPSPTAHAIIVPENSPVQTVADLKGKKIAISKGSISQALVLTSLEKAGLAWSDIEPAFLLPPDAKPAFEGGSVDAWAIWDPYFATEEVLNGARPIADEAYAGLRFGNFYFVTRAYATEHKDVVDIVIAALIERDAWVDAHPAEVAEIVSGITGVPANIQEVAENRRNYTLGPITEQVIADQQQLADIYAANKIIPRPIDIASATLPEFATLPAGLATPAAAN